MRKFHSYQISKKFVALCAGLAIAGQSVTAQTPNPKATRSVTLVPYQDTWTVAVERWWDIASNRSNNVDRYNQYNDWVTNGQPNGKFSYAVNPQVTLTYDTSPGVPYFVGHIKATGL